MTLLNVTCNQANWKEMKWYLIWSFYFIVWQDLILIETWWQFCSHWRSINICKAGNSLQVPYMVYILKIVCMVCLFHDTSESFTSINHTVKGNEMAFLWWYYKTHIWTRYFLFLMEVIKYVINILVIGSD